MIRVAVVGDTHGVLDPRVAEAVARCDYAVHTGDVGAAAVLAQMQPREGLVVSVRGNNDVPGKWPPGERDVVDALPTEADLDLPGGRLVVVHGDRVGPAKTRHAWLRRRYPHARVIAYGHSHRQVCDDGKLPWVVNPGAAGRARTFGGPSLIILHAGVRLWRLEARRFEPLPARERTTHTRGHS